MNILIDGQTLETPEINRGIGSYFKNLVNNMIKQDFVNKWYISVSHISHLEHLDPWAVEKINVIEDKDFSPNNFHQRGYSANKEYTEKLTGFIKKNKIDIYWNPNPVMINVLFPMDKLPCKFYATFYDLIPLVFKNKYVDSWDKWIKDEYLRRLDYLNKEHSNLLFISESTSNDFNSLIGNDYNSSKVTFLGAESKLFYRPYEVTKKKENYEIIYVGGFDFRKNLYKAVEAFSKAKTIYSGTIIDKAKFSIICKYSEHEKEKLLQFIDKLDMTEHVELKGFVSDLELSNLYRECDLFFFPSIYEGFGLPVLEALLSGAYILTGNNSSLSEVSKEYAMYCDSNNINEMADKIYISLKHSVEEPVNKKRERKQYALQFGWGQTANQTLEFFSNNQLNNEKRKSKLALITPWPLQKTGIANYVYQLIPSLSKYFDIDIFVDDSNTKGIKYKEYQYGNIYSINRFKDMYENYDEILYQLGNNSEFHTQIYELAIEIPGIIEVHDYNINPFMYHSFFIKNKKKIYKNTLLFYGEKGKKHYEDLVQGSTHPDMDRFPMIHYIASKSKGVIVHSRWVAEQLMDIDDIYVIPLASFDKSFELKDFNKKEFFKKYQLNNCNYIIGCLGFVNKNKRPEKIMEAVSILKEEGYPISLIFFGSAGGEKDRLMNFAKEAGIDNDVKITGFLNEKDYFEGISVSDLIVNLRYPSMGESSATLCQAFKYGKPTMISNLNQYTEFPDEVCWKVDVFDNEVQQLVGMVEYLLKNKDVRFALGQNAEIYAQNVLNVKNIAEEYYKVLNKLNYTRKIY